MRHLKKLFLLPFFVFLANNAFGQNCITLTSPAGTDAQNMCFGTAITPIVYDIAPGAIATVTGLPEGIAWEFKAHTVTIQGTSTLSGSYIFTVTVTGICPGTPTATGTITIYPLPLVTFTGLLTSQCVNSTTYTLTGGLPAGGFYSGPGVTGTNFNASVAGVGIHILTYTFKDVNGCENSATNSIEVIALPTVTFTGILTAQCASSTTYLLTGGSPAGGTYSGPGVTGTNFNASIVGAGTHTITYSYTNTGGCTSTATNTITVYPLPVATLISSDADNIFCMGTTIIFTAGGGQTYNFRVNNSSVQSGILTTYTSSTLTNGQIVDVVVTDLNGCASTSAGITNIVNPVPVATANNNGPLCPGTTLNLTGGPGSMLAYAWSGPDGFSSALQNPVVENVTEVNEGAYSLTVTNSYACQNTTITNAVVRPLPSVTATNNGPVCAGSPLRLIGGPVGMAYLWNGPNGFTSTAQSPQVSASATIAMAGTYTLRVTDIYGCQNTGSTVAVVNSFPVATAANNGPVCIGSQLTLTGGPSEMSSYSWTGPNGFASPSQNPTVSVSATSSHAGVYTLIVTNSAGCSGMATTTVVINALPVATAANNGPVCAGASLGLTGGPANMASYSWTGPNLFTSSLPSPVVNAVSTTAMNGVYTLTVTDIAGCHDTATTRAYVYAVPVANAGTGGVECDLNFTLNAVPSVGIGLWTRVTGPGTASFLPDAANPTATVTVSAYGTYTFRWTETNGPCISNSVVTVNFYQPPSSNAGTGGNECDLDFILNAVPSSGTGTWTMTTGTGTANFIPDANSPGATVNVSEYGTKEFKWKETNGVCSDSAIVTVNFSQQPIANPGTGGNNCGHEFNLRATPSIGTGTWTRESGPGTAVFSPDATTPGAKVLVNTFGTYVFRWTELNGTCFSSATITVTFIDNPIANGGPGGHECDLTFQLNATLGPGTGTWSKAGGPGNVLFTPSASEPNAVATVSQFGSYDLAWTEVNSLCSSTDIIRVTFHDLPSVNAGPDVTICKGSRAQLNATGSGDFLWAPAAVLNNATIPNPLATPVISTLFTVTLTDEWGCKNNDQVGVEVRAQPVADAGPDQDLAYRFETILEAAPLAAGQTGEWTFLTGTGDLSDIHDPGASVSNLDLNITSLIWTVTNGICPVSADTVDIIVRDLRIPTLITPNLDGKNDFFVINGLESLGKTSLTVFNRWGGRVYEKVNYDNKWNGIDENEDDLPEDTYFFILKTEKSSIIKGYVVIRR